MKRIARVALIAPLTMTAVILTPTLHAQAAVVARDTAPVTIQKPTADLITREQLQSRTFPNAYTAIEALRGNWLRIRNLNPPPGTVYNAPAGSQSAAATAARDPMPREQGGIKVYVDGVRVGGLEALKAIPVVNVYSMRRISGTEAQGRFGIGHSDGVIFVATGPDKSGSS